MQEGRRILRQNRLRKYARILSDKYHLEVIVKDQIPGTSFACTDTTKKIYIQSTVDLDEFMNLLLHKGLTLHEIGHVLFTSSKAWEDVDRNISSIIEDGRIEEAMSRRFPKARMYFIFINHKLLHPDKVEEESGKKLIDHPIETKVMQLIFRTAKQTTGIPPLPKKVKESIIAQIGQTNYDWIVRNTKSSVKAKTDKESATIAKKIEKKMREIFGMDEFNGFYGYGALKIVPNADSSIEKAGSTSQRMPDISKEEQKVIREITKELQKEMDKHDEEEEKRENEENESKEDFDSLDFDDIDKDDDSNDEDNKNDDNDKENDFDDNYQPKPQKTPSNNDLNDSDDDSVESEDYVSNDEIDDSDEDDDEQEDNDDDSSFDSKLKDNKLEWDPDDDDTNDEDNDSDGEMDGNDHGPGGDSPLDGEEEIDEDENDEEFKKDSVTPLIEKISQDIEDEIGSELLSETDLLKLGDIESQFDDYDVTDGEDPFFGKYARRLPIDVNPLEPLANRMAHLFRMIAQKGNGWNHNKTRGRLEMHKITSLLEASDRPRIFKKKEETDKVDLSAIICLDSSGSMKTICKEATQAAYVVSRALELNNYQSEVISFGVKSSWKYNHDIFGMKSFNQKLSFAKDNFKPMAIDGTPLLTALVGAERSIKKVDSKRKVIFVVTDGAPNEPELCKAKINRLEQSGIQVVGVLLSYRDEYHLFHESRVVICNDINQLPFKMSDVIKKILIKITARQ